MITAWKASVFGDFQVRILPHLDWIREFLERIPYSVQMQENMDQKYSEYGNVWHSA